MQTKSKFKEFFGKLESSYLWLGVVAALFLKIVILAISLQVGWWSTDKIGAAITFALAYAATTAGCIAMIFLFGKVQSFVLRGVMILFILYLSALDFATYFSFRLQLEAQKKAKTTESSLINLDLSISDARLFAQTACAGYKAALEDESKYKQRRFNECKEARLDYKLAQNQYDAKEKKVLDLNDIVYTRLAALTGWTVETANTVVNAVYAFGVVGSLFVLSAVLGARKKDDEEIDQYPNGTPPPRGTRTKKDTETAPDKPKPVPVNKPESVPNTVPISTAVRAVPDRAKTQKPREIQARANEKYEGFICELQKKKFSVLTIGEIVSESKFVNSRDTARKYLKMVHDTMPGILDCTKDDKNHLHYEYKGNRAKLRAV